MKEAIVLFDGLSYCGSGGCNVEVYRELAMGPIPTRQQAHIAS